MEINEPRYTAMPLPRLVKEPMKIVLPLCGLDSTACSPQSNAIAIIEQSRTVVGLKNVCLFDRQNAGISSIVKTIICSINKSIGCLIIKVRLFDCQNVRPFVKTTL